MIENLKNENVDRCRQFCKKVKESRRYNQRTLTIRGRITAQLVSSLTRLEAIVSVNTNSKILTYYHKKCKLPIIEQTI